MISIAWLRITSIPDSTVRLVLPALPCCKHLHLLGPLSQTAVPLTLPSSQSDDKQLVDRIQEFKQIAASLQPVKAALTSGASSQRGASGQALAAAASTKREIGDCYIWGSWLGDAEVRASLMGAQ